MKLVDLEPCWTYRAGRVIGIRFICPVTKGPPHPDGHSICVLFANPPDGRPAHPNDPSVPGNNKGRRWQRTGATFATLTLTPSVDATTAEDCPEPDHRRCAHTHCWHGFVTNGDVR